MKNFKLKSYTIIELLISMLIMSIVSVLVYVLFSSFTKQFRMFSETEDTLMSYAFFKNTMKRDFFLSEKIQIENKDLKLEFKDYSIKYSMKKDFVLRHYDKENIVDTFFVKIKEIKPVFIQKSFQKILSKVTFNVGLFNDNTEMLLLKEYGTDIFINNYLKNEN